MGHLKIIVSNILLYVILRVIICILYLYNNIVTYYYYLLLCESTLGAQSCLTLILLDYERALFVRRPYCSLAAKDGIFISEKKKKQNGS